MQEVYVIIKALVLTSVILPEAVPLAEDRQTDDDAVITIKDVFLCYSLIQRKHISSERFINLAASLCLFCLHLPLSSVRQNKTIAHELQRQPNHLP